MNEGKEDVITLKPLSSVRPAKKPRKPKKPKSTPHSDHIPSSASPSKPITVLKRPVQEKPVEILQSPPTTSAPTPFVVSSRRPTTTETKTATGYVLPPTPAPTPTSTKPTPMAIRARTEPQIISKSLDNRPQTAPSATRNATTGQKKRDRLNRGRRKSDSNGPTKENVVRNHTEINQSDSRPNNFDESAKKISPIDENEPINEAELPYLQSEYVYPLKKKSNRFTRAVYFCRLCDHHINTLIQAKHHIANSDHIIAKEEKVLISLLASIPKPTQAHCEALNAILKLTSEKNGRSVEHLENCEQVVEILTALVKQRIHPECYVRMYGSCASGFALKSSNLNLELMYPDSSPKLNHATALMKCYFLIYETKNLFADVQKDFCHKWPFIKFSVNMGKFVITDVVLSVRNTQAYEVSQFLKTYTDSFPRLKIIGHVWRHWAKICDLDNFQNGGLPSYAFDLMLVHYLQQCQPPFLPVLHELDLTDEEKKEKNGYQKDVEKIRRALAETNSNEWNYAEIFIGLLRYYTVGNDYQASVVNVRSKTEVSRETKGWNKKRLAVEDPFMPFKNLAQLSNDMYTYFMRCLQNSYKYFGIPQTFSGPLFYYDNRKLVLSWYNDAACGGQSANRTNSAVMMTPHVVRPTTTLGRGNSMDVEKNAAERSFQVVFNSNARNVPANQSSTDDSMASSTAGVRLLASIIKSSSAESEPTNTGRRSPSFVEDPETSANSICGDDRSSRKHRSKQRTVRNFCIKKLTGMDDKCAENNHASEHHEKHDDGETPPIDAGFEKSKVRRDTVSSDDSQVEFQNENGDSDSNQQRPSTIVRCDSQDQREKEVEMVEKFDVDLELCSAASLLKPTDYIFEFEYFCFKNELTKPRVQCDSCRMLNHLAPYCPNPEKELPPLRFLPSMTNTYMDLQTFFVQSVFNYNRLSVKRIKFQEEFRQELEKRLRQIWPNSSLYLFGSSCNGFGFTHSDLDICLTFDNKPTLPEGVDPVKIIKKIARMMHQQTDFCDIFPVTRAKVPIVRFYHRESKLEGDISLYNILALRNTQLLYSYSMIDPRVQPLGYMAKVFAKQCDIGDASKGSLSSYAYVLMVIHYLQRRTPPVLPILQQIQVDPKRPQKFMVDGWDTYFYADLNNLPKIWKGYKKNKESIGELWLGFLIYYTEKFDPRNDVVQIRQSTPLTKFEKLWTDRPLAIEDPFDLNHNLASGLSKKMFLYIIKAFRRAREVFGDPIHEQKIYKRFLNDLFYENLGFYFFCVALQFNEPPPKDRVCKLCERVGHFVENCPMKRSNKGKWMDEMFFDDDDDLDDVEAMSPMMANENETNKTIVFENSSQYARTQSHPGLGTNDKAMPNVSRIVCPTAPMMPYQAPMMPQSAPIIKATSTMMPGVPYSWNSNAVPSMHAYHQQSSVPMTSFSPSQHTMAPKTLTSPYYMVNHHRK